MVTNKISKFFYYLTHINKIKIRSLKKKFLRNSDSLSDIDFIKQFYFLEFGTEIDLDEPKTFSEKLNWLKLYYHNPLQIILCDKYRAKQYLETLIDKNYLPITFGVWEKFENIQFDKLPNKFVLKTTHDCGGNVIVDKNYLNLNALKKILNSHLKINYYLTQREWPYKDVQPRIIAEEFLELKKIQFNNKYVSLDYKFYCFNGNIEYFMISYDETNHLGVNHKFNMKKECIDYLFKKECSCVEFDIDDILPSVSFECMKLLAEKISHNFPHCRVDFYLTNTNRVYVGEVTFYTNGGFPHIYNKEYDRYLGSLIKLIKY